MRVADAFIAKGLVPVTNHTNDTYAMVERDGQSLVNGLLSRRDVRVFVAVAHSARPAAVTFRQDDVYLMAVTGTLLRRLEEAVIGYLKDPGIAAFLNRALGLNYACDGGWPKTMTWGANPDSRRSEIATDVRYALFYEIFDEAWTFALLHEASHIENGDLETPSEVDLERTSVEAPARPLREFDEDPDNLAHRLRETADLISYGGMGLNRYARIAEFHADRNAACWLTQLLLRKYVEEPERSGAPDPFALLHLLLGAFGAMAAVLLIAHHDPDGEATMPTQDHPSFDARLVGIWEGIEAVLEDPECPLEVVDGYRLQHAVTLLRQQIESVVFGAPGKFTITI